METLRNKSQEEIDLERTLEEVRESTRQAREDKQQAIEALEKIESPSGDRPSLWRKRLLQLGLAGILTGGGSYVGYEAGKKMGWWGNHPPEKKVGQRKADQTKTNEVYRAPATTNLTEEARRLANAVEQEKPAQKVTPLLEPAPKVAATETNAIPKPPASDAEEIAKLRAEINEKLEKRQAEFDRQRAELSNELAQTRTALSNEVARIKAEQKPPAPIAPPNLNKMDDAEFFKYVREHPEHKLTGDQAMRWNYLIQQRPKR